MQVVFVNVRYTTKTCEGQNADDSRQLLIFPKHITLPPLLTVKNKECSQTYQTVFSKLQRLNKPEDGLLKTQNGGDLLACGMQKVPLSKV